MNNLEDDPDTLQILDELDRKWVRGWRRATDAKISKTPKLTIIVPNQEKTRLFTQKTKHKI